MLLYFCLLHFFKIHWSKKVLKATLFIWNINILFHYTFDVITVRLYQLSVSLLSKSSTVCDVYLNKYNTVDHTLILIRVIWVKCAGFVYFTFGTRFVHLVYSFSPSFSFFRAVWSLMEDAVSGKTLRSSCLPFEFTASYSLKQICCCGYWGGRRESPKVQ